MKMMFGLRSAWGAAARRIARRIGESSLINKETPRFPEGFLDFRLRLLHFLPVVLGHVGRELQRAVRAREDRLVDLRDLAAAVLLEVVLDQAVEAAQLAAAAREDDVLQHALLEFGVVARHELAETS